MYQIYKQVKFLLSAFMESALSFAISYDDNAAAFNP